MGQRASNGSVTSGLRRRELLAWCAGAGLGATAFPRALWAQVSAQAATPPAPARVTLEMIDQALKVAGITFSEPQRRLMERGVNQTLDSIETMRRLPLPNELAPCLVFDPLPPGKVRPAPAPRVAPKLPAAPAEPFTDPEELAFRPLWQLSELVRTREITSVELTEMYLARLERFAPKLLFVVTLLREQALAQAKQADAEIEAGKWRGPLHGIPWGAKDLLATKGVKTTWGAEPYREQVAQEDAAVVEKLRDAGAVLVAKLTLGALAMGDVWFGGMTRNPWRPEEGSSGSSAGSAAATAAGCTGFAIGSETLGSIVSPSSRCGVTGLRPTFGRVSRRGAMALSWSMDKLGALCRSALDCALVLDAIGGRDERDRSTVDVPFLFDATRPIGELKVGYLKEQFQRPDSPDAATLETLKGLGVDLRPAKLPDLAIEAISMMLTVEAASAFDDLTRDGGVDQLKEQGPGAWPNLFRTARLVPAVEYLRAARLRTRLIEETAAAFGDLDVIVAPAFGGNTLTLTNLTGHPALCLPNGFRKNGTPSSITFLGKLYGDAEILRLGHAFQAATDFHRKTPEAFVK
jgi:Asp-tRNA(Asn)/Glu-tRNA(Gln) amidotransferase A subunit family amidase